MGSSLSEKVVIVEKSAEKIKLQLIKSMGLYRTKKKCYFFDTSSASQKMHNFEIDHDDLEVALISINRSTFILLTTKSLFLERSGSVQRINGTDIQDFESVNFVESHPNEHDSKRTIFYKKYRMRRHTGNFRITKNDGTFIEVYLSKRYLTHCLSEAVKKLQFVSEKYNRD